MRNTQNKQLGNPSDGKQGGKDPMKRAPRNGQNTGAGTGGSGGSTGSGNSNSK